MIELKDITYSYRKSSVPALNGITATVQPGIVLLAGENGSGKTTLLKLLAGLYRPTSGECVINGAAADSNNPGEMGKTFFLDERMFFPGKTIREFASMHSRFYPNFSNDNFMQALMAFRLTGNEPMKSLSLGNLKKSQLAYVLSLGVDVLLLDEPTNALDIESKTALKRLIASSMSDTQTIIVSTHTVTELDTLFDSIVMLTRSRLTYAGQADAITDRISFEVNRMPNPNALYYEIQAGRVLNIVPTEPGMMTKVDWRLLYSALHSPAAEKIISLLNQPQPPAYHE